MPDGTPSEPGNTGSTERLTEDLEGGMGVSSERPGKVRGSDEPATSGELPTERGAEPADPPPEQSAYDGEPDPSPVDPPNRSHYGRLHGNPSAPDERGEGRRGTGEATEDV